MAETVLVTGGSGFIGGWCIAELLGRGYAVRTTVRSAGKEASVRAAVARVANTERLSFAIADLTKDDGWDAAAKGCDFVLHVASPLGGGDEKTMIAAAQEGTLRVLGAATRAGVKRVVMTSAAATARPPLRSKKPTDETVWADVKDPQFDAYRRSKILAERAAWDFMAGKKTEFATVLPGAVFGPVLTKETLGSVGIIAGLLKGRPPALAKIGFWIVDVRDLAQLHIRAMTAPAAAGERFIGSGEFLWMADVAKILREGLGKRGAKVPVRQMSNLTVRFLSLFARNLRSVAPLLGVRNEQSSAKARRMLGFAPRPAKETVLDCAESLLG